MAPHSLTSIKADSRPGYYRNESTRATLIALKFCLGVARLMGIVIGRAAAGSDSNSCGTVDGN